MILRAILAASRTLRARLGRQSPSARRVDVVALDGEAIAEGQGEDAAEDVDLPAFLTADLPKSAKSMMAAE